MPKTPAERMRDHRNRKRAARYAAGTLRRVGRPKKVVRSPHTHRCNRIENIIYAVWHDLREEGVTELSFRSLRYRANKYATRHNGKQLAPYDVYWGVHSQNGNDRFYCQGESQAGWPLKITVTDPA